MDRSDKAVARTVDFQCFKEPPFCPNDQNDLNYKPQSSANLLDGMIRNQVFVRRGVGEVRYLAEFSYISFQKRSFRLPPGRDVRDRRSERQKRPVWKRPNPAVRHEMQHSR